jgi:hypothetical protein
VVGEERAPGLRRPGAALGDQPGDGTLADIEAELEQFAMDSGGAPQGIRRRHPRDKGSDLGADGRAATGGPAGERGPVESKPPPLPPQDGVWRYDHEGRPPPGPHPGQPGPDEPIASPQRGPAHRPLVHGELLAQGDVLEGELAVAAA